MISSTEVVLTILFAALFLKEKLTSKKLLLATISFSGVFLLMGANFQNSQHSSITGDLLVLLGTIFAVVYVLFSKMQVSKINPLELTASQQLVGLIATVICFSLFSIANPNYEVNAVGISLLFWLLAIVSGILQYALAFLLYLTALQTVQVSHAAFYLALIPVFGVASAILLLGEQPSLMQWLSAFLVIASSCSANTLRTN